jgi:hypothetical protein
MNIIVIVILDVVKMAGEPISGSGAQASRFVGRVRKPPHEVDLSVISFGSGWLAYCLRPMP